MKKILFFILFILNYTIFSNSCFPETRFDLGYFKDKNTDLKSISFYQDYTTSTYNNVIDAKFRQSNLDFTYSFRLQPEFKITPEFNFFAFAEVEKNTILKINDRFELGLGGGLLIFKDLPGRNKVSYALIFFDKDIQHSFRYKFNYESYFFDAAFFINYMLPINELDSYIDLTFKVIKLFGIGYKIEYKTNNFNWDYIQNLYLRINL